MPRFIDIINSPWAIMPEKLQQIQRIYISRINKEKIDIGAIEAQIGKPLKNKSQHNYEVINGVAVIEIMDVIGKKFNFFSDISGGASTQIIGNQLDAATDNPDIIGIMLYIDSPGGDVDGYFELGEKIFEAREKKSIIAFTDGTMASAAYRFGAAAHKIYISGNSKKQPSPTTQIGSIGVYTSHMDISEAEKKAGIKVTEIVAGKYKNSLTQHQALTKEGFKEYKESVDFIYTEFVGAISKYRKISIEKVLAMAEGRVFMGEKAITAGLADGVSTFEGVIDMLASGGLVTDDGGSSNDSEIISGQSITIIKEGEKVDIETLKKDHPDIYAQIKNEGIEEGRQVAIAEGKKAGAIAELDRIKAVEKSGLPGHEALINTLKFDGKTTGPEAAAQVVQAENGRLDGMNRVLKENAPSAAEDAAIGQNEGVKKDYETLVSEYLTEHKCKKRVAIRAIVIKHPKEYDAYIKRAQTGRKNHG